MPNEMTPLEAAEKLESLATEADSIEPEKYGGTKLVDVTFHVPGDIKALRCAASYLRQIAAGEYKPVVHGHLKDHYSGEYDDFANCSVCGAENLANSKFCRMCGALMGGKDDSHERSYQQRRSF